MVDGCNWEECSSNYSVVDYVAQYKMNNAKPTKTESLQKSKTTLPLEG